MKKIMFVFFSLILLLAAGCSSEIQQQDKVENPDDNGYLNDIEDEFDNSETDSLDEDLNLDWI